MTVIKAAKGSQKNITSDADVTCDVPLKTTMQYVYIFAVHFAGNCSAATELIIPAEPVDVPQKWPVYSILTAMATAAPAIGLLPIPIMPIISACASTEQEPANSTRRATAE